MADKNKLLDEIVKHEDAARHIATRIEWGDPDLDTRDAVAQLARSTARLAQAVREAFEPIVTSDFQR